MLIFQKQKAGASVLSGGEHVRELHTRWQELCKLYVPLLPVDSAWRYSRLTSPADIEQGWKLHVSATILTANDVLEKVAPFLHARKALFKTPLSLLELGKLNAGIHYGYSQIGKFITVYPQTNEEALDLAEELHRLTTGLAAPMIPFDTPFCEGSSVYYRYGAFKYIEMDNPDGSRTPVIKDYAGNLTPDRRDTKDAAPDWVLNPFPKQEPNKILAENPLRTTFKVFRALAQRGKGGVYQAVDLSTEPPRLCIIKEGRKDGEVDWHGCDGYGYVKREAGVLSTLQSAGVPSVYSSFELGNNFYLVTEYIEGASLDRLLVKRKRRLSIKRAIKFGIKLASLLTKIHSAGWVWRDCKPANIVVTKNQNLRPIDFEGAGLINEPPLSISGTPGFIPPESLENHRNQSSIPADLYALGAVLYYLFTGRFYLAENTEPIKKLRRNVPLKIEKIIARLLATNPLERPEAEIVKRELESELKFINGCGNRIK